MADSLSLTSLAGAGSKDTASDDSERELLAAQIAAGSHRAPSGESKTPVSSPESTPQSQQSSDGAGAAPGAGGGRKRRRSRRRSFIDYLFKAKEEELQPGERGRKLWAQARLMAKMRTAVTAMQDEVELYKVFGQNTYTKAHRTQLTSITQKLMVHPDEPWRQYWDVAHSIVLLWITMMTPFEVCFLYYPTFGNTAGEGLVSIFFHAVLLFLIADVVLNFRTAVQRHELLMQEPMNVAKFYVMHGTFVWDLISAVPLDLFLVSSYPRAAIAGGLRLFRLVHTAQLTKLMRAVNVRHFVATSSFGSLVGTLSRYLKLALAIATVVHSVACVWYALTWLQPAFSNNDTWAVAFEDDMVTLGDKYLVSLYWSCVTITTVGYGDIVPQTDLERVCVVFIAFLGNLTFAFVVGNVSTMASQMGVTKQIFNEKMDAVNEFMESRRMPAELRDRIRKYYHTFWMNGIYFNENTILGDLTFDLKKQITEYLHRDIVKAVPFLKCAPAEALELVLSRLITKHALEGDVIVKEGGAASTLYVVRKGVLQAARKGVVVHYIARGAFFGEDGLVFPNRQRKYTVTAVRPAELACLTRSDFDIICEAVPAFRAVVAIAAHERRAGDEEAFQRKRAVPKHKSLLDHVESLESSLGMGSPVAQLARMRRGSAAMHMAMGHTSPKSGVPAFARQASGGSSPSPTSGQPHALPGMGALVQAAMSVSTDDERFGRPAVRAHGFEPPRRQSTSNTMHSYPSPKSNAKGVKRTDSHNTIASQPRRRLSNNPMLIGGNNAARRRTVAAMNASETQPRQRAARPSLVGDSPETVTKLSQLSLEIEAMRKNVVMLHQQLDLMGRGGH